MKEFCRRGHKLAETRFVDSAGRSRCRLCTLRKHGEWPYRPMSIPRASEIIEFYKPADAELNVLNECFQRLSTLDADQRSRVLRYLGDRLDPYVTTGTIDVNGRT